VRVLDISSVSLFYIAHLAHDHFGGYSHSIHAPLEPHKFDKKIRRMLIEEKARYKANSRVRLYLPAEKGGCNLKSIRDSIEETTIYTWAYLSTRADLKPSLHLFEKMANRGKRSIVSDARAVLKSYNINAEFELATSTVTVDGVQFTNPKKVGPTSGQTNEGCQYH
jgi:hypothetical protein